jgi:hypothetical protein
MNKDFINFEVQAITLLALLSANQATRTKCSRKMSRRRLQLCYASNTLCLLTTLNRKAGVKQHTPLHRAHNHIVDRLQGLCALFVRCWRVDLYRRQRSFTWEKGPNPSAEVISQRCQRQKPVKSPLSQGKMFCQVPPQYGGRLPFARTNGGVPGQYRPFLAAYGLPKSRSPLQK